MCDEEKKQAFEHGMRITMMSFENVFVHMEKVLGLPLKDVYAEMVKGFENDMEEFKKVYVEEGFEVMKARVMIVRGLLEK